MKTQEFDRSALGWVRKEVDETLSQAAQALQEYSEDPSDRTRLSFCATYLHQVYGTLQMLELFGVSLLAEEMEHLIEAMLAGEVAEPRDAEEALMTAILRVSELLERIQAGQNDSPIAVLSVVNDLRSVRGEALLSEGALFFADSGADPGLRRQRGSAGDLATAIRKHRPRYQRGLLGLLRGNSGAASLQDMLSCLERLDDACLSDRSGDLWWVASGVVEGLTRDALKAGAAVKGLLGQLDQQMRRVLRDGEPALMSAPPTSLFSNLLYYVGQSGPITPRLQSIHDRFGLQDLVDEASQQQGRTFAPGSDILESVATAIREDITGVKESLDLFVRGEQRDGSRLQNAGPSLQRVADTLGMLGLDSPRNMISKEIGLIERLASGGEADDSQLLDMAKALLFVESSLDSLVSGGGGIRAEAGSGDGAAAALPDDAAFFDMEYQSVFRTTVREAVVDIGALKDTIIQFIEREDHGALGEVGDLTQRLQGALGMVGLDRAGGLVRQVAAYLHDQVLGLAMIPGGDALDTLADAITSLEYYLEAVLENRHNRDSILEVAESSMARLGDPAPADLTAMAGQGLVADAGIEQRDAADAATAPVAGAAPATAGAVPGAGQDAEAADQAADQARPVSTGGINLDIAVRASDLDDEIVEIFLEEVDEVLEVLRECYPRWRRDNSDAAALATARRMFHTLKGSGRMAGALLLGELGWCIERLLNRIIDGHVEPGPEVYDVVERAMDAMPELARELVTGTPPSADIRWIMNKADILAEPRRYGELAEPGSVADAPGGLVPAAPEEPLPLVVDGDGEGVTAADAGLGADPGQPYQAGPTELSEQSRQSDRELAAVDDDDDDEQTADVREQVEFIRSIYAGALPPDAVAEQAGDAGPDQGQADDESMLAPDDALSDALDPEPGFEFALDAEFQVTPESDAESDADADAEAETSVDLEQIDFGIIGESVDGVDEEPLSEPVSETATETETETEPAMDPVLYEIFSNETDDHLAAVRAFIQGCSDDSGQCGVTEALSRALHTLTGSARMAAVDPVARLGRRLDEFVGLRSEHGRQLDGADMAILEAGAQRISEVIRALGVAGTELPDIQDLLDSIDSLCAEQELLGEAAPDEADLLELEPEEAEATGVDTAEHPEEQDLIAEHPAASLPDETIASATEDALAEPVDDDLVTLFLEEAEDILAFMDSAISEWEEDSGTEARINELHRSLHTLKGGARLARFKLIGDLCHALEGLTSDVEAHRIPADDAFFNLLHVVMERLGGMVANAQQGLPGGDIDTLLAAIQAMRGAAAAHPQESPSPAAVAEEERDLDLVDIFLEEAAEILQVIESEEQRWADQPDDQEHLVEIQRALHTMKGGARMAGFPPIANLSHGMETLLNAVRDHSVNADHRVFELLELSHDRLHSMREQAGNGVVLAEATDLLAGLEALRRADQVPAHDQAAPAAGLEDPADASKSGKKAAAPARAGQPAVATAADAGHKVQNDQVRVRADQLDNFVNFAGEISIYRARLDQQVGAFRFNLTELDQTVVRLREQLRTLEIETEAQIIYRHEREHEQVQKEGDFDPLELDRFSRMQELSRGLSESVGDLGSIQGLLDNLAKESETLLLQQSRVNSELQDGLMRTRMVPFANLAPRLRRIVRQTAQELGRKAQIKLQGAQGEMDRTVLERVTAPLEHMLRNAVAHGVEPAAVRRAAGKPETGDIIVSLDREGADVVLRVQDDGAGLDLDAIRRKAVDRGLLAEGAVLTDREVMQFVLEQGFSTAREVTQIAGRGVGMDVVNSEIKQLGGTLEIDSVTGIGTQFTVRLPFTLAMNQALLCAAGENVYAIPLTSIEGVVRLSGEQLETFFTQEAPARYVYGGVEYEVNSLSALLGFDQPSLAGLGKRVPVVLVHAGDHRLALQMDSLIGSREIVVKSVGSQISTVPGIFGATILADGRVVLILDISSLARLGSVADRRAEFALDEQSAGADAGPGIAVDTRVAAKPLIMVVDDSITMRKVATRLLERNNMQVITAKDGVDAVAKLQEQVPDAMLLDIEMPRMDGYELATHMRNDERLHVVPIIMITSRTGDKHRERAMSLGVNRYMGKPYQEQELLENLNELLDMKP